MRLLKTETAGLDVKYFSDGTDIPKYAILSHTWYEDDEEITFGEKELPTSTLEQRKGWHKIAGSKARAAEDGFHYIWIDTLCIDKSSSTELAEAINSMYRYYQEAQVCYVYLNDMPDPTPLVCTRTEANQSEMLYSDSFDDAIRMVESSETSDPGPTIPASTGSPSINPATTSANPKSTQQPLITPAVIDIDPEDVELRTFPTLDTAYEPGPTALRFPYDGRTYLINLESFRQCRWFTRGWTLQELLAPMKVRFFSTSWHLLPEESLFEEIRGITNIHVDALSRARAPASFSIAQRMSWAADRITRRPEDRAYSLMGLFDVNITVLYGEGNGAFHRLQEEIVRRFTSDFTIFVFDMGLHGPWPRGPGYRDLLAKSPDQFCNSGNVIMKSNKYGGGYSVTDQDVTFDALTLGTRRPYWLKFDYIAPNTPSTEFWNAASSFVVLPCTLEDDGTKLMALRVHEVSSHGSSNMKNHYTCSLSCNGSRITEQDMRFMSNGSNDARRRVVSVTRQWATRTAESSTSQPLQKLLMCRHKIGNKPNKRNVDNPRHQRYNWKLSGTCSPNGSWNSRNDTFEIWRNDQDDDAPFTGQLSISYEVQRIADLNFVITDRSIQVNWSTNRVAIPWWLCGGYCMPVRHYGNEVLLARGHHDWKAVDGSSGPMITILAITENRALIRMALQSLIGFSGACYYLLGYSTYIFLFLPWPPAGYGLYRLWSGVTIHDGGYIAFALVVSFAILIAALYVSTFAIILPDEQIVPACSKPLQNYLKGR